MEDDGGGDAPRVPPERADEVRGTCGELLRLLRASAPLRRYVARPPTGVPRVGRPLDICVSLCVPVGHMRIPMRARWTYAYPYACPLDICVSLCPPVGHMRIPMRAQVPGHEPRHAALGAAAQLARRPRARHDARAARREPHRRGRRAAAGVRVPQRRAAGGDPVRRAAVRDADPRAGACAGVRGAAAVMH